MLEQLLLPRRDLGRMHLMLLGEFGERLVAADRWSVTLALNAGEWLRRDHFMVTAPLKD